MLSRSIDRGVVIVPEPVVSGAILVPRSGMPLVLPLWPAAAGSVGDGVVGLTLGPDWLAGAGALCAKADAVGSATINAATARLRNDMFDLSWFPLKATTCRGQRLFPSYGFLHYAITCVRSPI